MQSVRRERLMLFTAAIRYHKKPSKESQRVHNVSLVFTFLQEKEEISLLGIGRLCV